MRVVVAICSVLLTLACAPARQPEYRYTPPSDDNGRACVSQCSTAQTHCGELDAARVESERMHCETDAGSAYQHCLIRSVNGADRAECTQRSCYVASQVPRCEQDFRTCYQACGGAVEPH